jgi:hypothetical protein
MGRGGSKALWPPSEKFAAVSKINYCYFERSKLDYIKKIATNHLRL